MTHSRFFNVVQVVAAASLVAVASISNPHAQQKAPVKIPEPGVPQIMTLEGEFVRIAYNNEGYVSLGYRVANESLGQEWMLLQVGTTIRYGVQNFDLTRAAWSIETPDKKNIPMASNEEYRQVDLRGIELRATTVPESINYFPPEANQACRLGYFASIDTRLMAYDQVELSSNRACVGQIYFHVPGGIKYGQHFLNVKFRNSLVRVPFRILTKDEEKQLSKTWKDVKKQVEQAFKKGK